MHMKSSLTAKTDALIPTKSKAKLALPMISRLAIKWLTDLKSGSQFLKLAQVAYQLDIVRARAYNL